VARRSPTNARYQKYQEPPGKTRKSAAAAKPSRKATASASSAPKSKTSRVPVDPPTQEFKQLRKRWWILLLASVILVAASWGMRSFDHPGMALGVQFALGSMKLSYAGFLSAVLLGLAYACIFYAFYLDFSKMRPMRQAYSEEMRSADKPAKPSKKDSSKA